MSIIEEIELFPMEGQPSPGFKCSREEQNVFLYERAYDEQVDGFSVTYLAFYKGIHAGFLTVAMDAIALQTKEKPRSDVKLVRLPAMKIVQLAVSESLEGQGLGKALVALGVGIALEVRRQVGCRYVTVDAKPDLVEWYADQEFKRNKIDRKEKEERAREHGLDIDEMPVSMRMDLLSLTEDLADVYPNDFPRD